jgi:hypothetical protein
MAREVHVDSVAWRVVRQPGATAGARASGDYEVRTEGAGLWFHSERGPSRFYACDQVDLPTEQDLAAMPSERLAELLRRASTP